MTAQLVFLLIFVVLQVLDIWTTLTALKQGGREMNPVLAWLFKHFPPLWTMVVVKAFGVAALIWAGSVYVTSAACALYAWVVINNWKVIKG